MFYSVDILRTSSLEGSISSNPETTTPWRWWGEPGYIGVSQQGAGSSTKTVNKRKLDGFLGGSDGKESVHNAGDLGSDPWVEEIPWRKTWQSTPAFLPGESLWTEVPGRLQSTGSQRVKNDWELMILHRCLQVEEFSYFLCVGRC